MTAPVAVLDLSWDDCSVDVDPAFTAARVLVRAGVVPLGWVLVPLVDGKADASVVRRLVADPPERQPEPPATAAVTVVLCTVGRPQMLQRAVRSLLASDHPDFEVLVVDNRPSDPSTKQAVAELEDPRLRVVDEPVKGLSAARNRGVVEARHDVVAFTDDDVVVDPQWLRWLTAPVVAGEADVATGLVLPSELATQTQLHFEGYGGFAKGLERRAWDLSTPDHSHLVYPFSGGSFGSGNAMAFRREALERIGGFDLALGAGSVTGGGEDIDAFTHLVLTGSTLVYEPRAVCWHEHRRDEAALTAQVWTYGTGFGAVLVKWVLRSGRLRLGLLRKVLVLLQALRPGRPQAAADRPDAPPELSVLELRGMLASPWLYAKAVVAARRVRGRTARVRR